MSYKVIKYFTDLEDKSFPYEVGDSYPRKGLKVSKERIAQLMGSNNRQGVPLIIEEVEEKIKKANTKNTVNEVE